MGYRVSGTLRLPDGTPANNAEIEFISRKNFSPLVQELKSNVKCGATGAYDVTLEYGEYAVIVYPGGTYPAALGTIILAADTVAGQDLPTLLQHEGWQPATPEYVQQIQVWLSQADKYAQDAKQSADDAASTLSSTVKKDALTSLGGELDPAAAWSGVPAHSDAEIGGPLNAQAEALAARTKLLRTEVVEALRRSYAEAGYNLVAGSFEVGGTLVNANDVLLHEASGKAYSGPAGNLPAGTDPASGGFVDRSAAISITFSTVTEMLAATWVVSGQRVRWLGYYEPSDGGGNWGVVKSGAHIEDGGSIFSISPSLYIEANTAGKRITLKKFGCIQDGVTVDTVQFYKAVDFAINNNLILDGKGYPLLISDSNIKTLTSTTSVKLHNLTIVPGLTYTDQPRLIFQSDVEYELVNIKVKGGRGTKVGLEPWRKFSVFGGYDSITPSTGNMITIGGGLIQSNITVSGFDARNCHYESLIIAFTSGTITAEKFYFENCSNKQFHFWHGIDGGAQPLTGITNLDGYVARNCGILPASFTVDGVTKSRADAVAPQGAFGCIVTYGTFNHSNIFVYNYGATGVTADRNITAMGCNVKICHNDPAAFNNNPSGAYWDELCGNCTVDGLEIRITARDPRETPIENSALQIYKGSSGTFFATNVVIETTGSAGINKDIRASLGNGSQLSINGYSLESKGIQSISVLQKSGLSAKVELKSGRVRGAPMRITQSGSVMIEGLDSDQNLTIDQSLPSPIGGVSIAESKCNILTVNGSNGLINIDGGSIANLNVSGITGASVHLDGGLEIRGVALLTGLKSLTVGDIETERRLEVRNVERVKMCGSVLKTSSPEGCLTFSPTAADIMKHVSLIGVSRWIKTGTVGAGHTATNANTPTISDISPDNKTFYWT